MTCAVRTIDTAFILVSNRDDGKSMATCETSHELRDTKRTVAPGAP